MPPALKQFSLRERGLRWLGKSGEHGSELPELVIIQAEKDLIQHYGLHTVASDIEYEVRTVFTRQTGGVVNQFAPDSKKPCPQADGGVLQTVLDGIAARRGHVLSRPCGLRSTNLCLLPEFSHLLSW